MNQNTTDPKVWADLDIDGESVEVSIKPEWWEETVSFGTPHLFATLSISRAEARQLLNDLQAALSA